MKKSRVARVVAACFVAVSCTVAAQDSAGPQNHAPSISGSPSPSILQGDFFVFAPVASDAEGDTLTFWIQNKPGWADFHAPSGSLYGRLGPADIGRYENIQIWVTDGEAWAAMPAFDIDVLSAELPSVRLGWDAPTTNADGSPLTNLSGYRIYVFSVGSSEAQTVEVSDPQLTSYLLGNLTPDIFYFTITALNSAGRESESSPFVTYDAR
ncbi:MAG: fibronectin type III domain-containing protein [Chromatiales bacterium]|nr:MAG: fibronectin type III domain-containing protein [Chromatiales bacterium]